MLHPTIAAPNATYKSPTPLQVPTVKSKKETEQELIEKYGRKKIEKLAKRMGYKLEKD